MWGDDTYLNDTDLKAEIISSYLIYICFKSYKY